MSSVEPYFIKCLDEAGFKLPDVAKPNYGHSVVGEQCIEVQRYMGTPHVTLQVLAGLEGILYANTVNGTTDTHEFLKFFGKTSKTFLANRSLFFDMVTTSYLTTMQLITMKGGYALGHWMDQQRIEVVYLPTYSPEFNPTESGVYSCIKQI